jgi:hypothetical protein
VETVTVAVSASSVRTATAATRLLAQADLLAEIRAEARDAVLPVAARLTVLRLLCQQNRRLDQAQIEDLASLAVDAALVTRVLDSGVADRIQRSAQARAAATLAREPGLPPAQRQRAIEAAGALARMSRLARELQTPEYEEQVRRQVARLREQVSQCRPVSLPGHLAVRTAAQVRAAAAALANRRQVLRPEQLVRRRSRQRRMAELAERLVASATLPGQPTAPLSRPGNPALLAWLRAMMLDQRLYDPAAEHAAARSWLGTDLFGHWQPEPPPDFLAGVTYPLPAELVGPFLRRLSLTEPTPTAADLSVASLTRDKAVVSAAERAEPRRAWAGPLTGPVPLSAVTEIPRVVHGIWLGRPLPEGSAFWRSYAGLADHYRGQLDVVVWTDLRRGHLDAPAAQRMVDWARAHGIALVNVAEVFHAGAPMPLAFPVAMEMGRCVPGGFAAASDHLRVEIAYRFGGLYADGDLVFAPEGIPELLDRVAASPWGFTLNALRERYVWNDLIAAPAGHPAMALWREIARLNYLRSVVALCGGRITSPPPRERHNSAWTWVLTPARSGRMHHHLLRRLRLPVAELVPVRPVIRAGSELSWVPPASGEPAVPHPEGADVLPALQRGVAYLRWQLLARLGDLHLTGFDPVIRGLPEPDVAWGALLTALPELIRDLRPVTSVTATRRYDNAVLHEVALPPEARRLLRRSDGPWIGAGQDEGRGHVWLLDEMVVPARLARAHT